MMQIRLAFFCVLALCAASSQAQLRKCIEPDGKVTYSDVLCKSESKTDSVKGSVSTMDTSGLRAESAKSQAANAKAKTEEVTRNAPKSVYQRDRARFDKCQPSESAPRIGDMSSPAGQAWSKQYRECIAAAAKENY